MSEAQNENAADVAVRAEEANPAKYSGSLAMLPVRH